MYASITLEEEGSFIGGRRGEKKNTRNKNQKKSSDHIDKTDEEK